MRSYRVANPVTVRLSTPSHPFSPFSPLARRSTIGVALIDTSNTPSGHLNDDEPFTDDSQWLPVTRPLPPLPPRDFCDDMDNDGTLIRNVSPEPTASQFSFAPSSSCFPVYGPFDLLYCLQSGGFAAAWAARDQSTGRLLCLKAFQPLHNPGIKGPVRKELNVFRRIVKSKGGERGRQFIMELCRSMLHDTTVFFAMELMTMDLGTYLSVDPERCKLHARRWMVQLALGIASLHEMGIIHRDIKVENILIDSRENVRIIDFGLSWLEPNGEALHPDIKYTIDFLGTPPYMAPEVLRNEGMPAHRRKRYGPPVDWWALGCVLFELESDDHQVLFNSADDVHAYVAWVQRVDQLEEKYFRFKGLSSVVVSLLEGLLEIHPALRYTLTDLEEDEYFLLGNGKNLFDNAAARALDRPICPGLVPPSTGNGGPTLVVKAAASGSIYDWTNLKWGLNK